MSKHISLGQIVGHRGAGNAAPGSTMAALEKAASLGLEWVEFDVRLTKDHQLVIANADDLSNCSGQSIKISESTLEELAHINVGHSFEGTDQIHNIPLFESAVQFCIKQGIRTQIELKGETGSENTFAIALADSLRRSRLGFPKTFGPLVTSFTPQCLTTFKAHMKAPFLTGLLIHTDQADAWEATAKEVQPEFVHFYGGVIDGNRLTNKFGQSVKDAGYRLNAFKVNTKEDAKAAIKDGVERFTTDEPETILELLQGL